MGEVLGMEEILREFYAREGAIDVYYFSWRVGILSGVYLCDVDGNPFEEHKYDLVVGDEIEGQEDITFKNQVEICKYFKELCIKIGFVWKGKYVDTFFDDDYNYLGGY